MFPEEQIIQHTKNWIVQVVIGCNFCPFAAREIRRNSIHYEVLSATSVSGCLESLLLAFHKLDGDASIETMFLILPEGFSSFAGYLQLVDLSEQLLKNEDYEGIYQVAGFHPDYLFAGSTADDPANYTNRSPYPMLHLLREESVSRAVDSYPDTSVITQKNIEFARSKGLAYMREIGKS